MVHACSDEATLVHWVFFPNFISPPSVPRAFDFASTPSCLMFPVSSPSFPPSFPPSLHPWLPLPCCLSPLSLPGVVAMAREPAQMAGQLAFRGRAPQLKLPPFFPSFLLLSSSAQTFGLQLFMSGKPLSRRAWCEGERQGPPRGRAISNAWAVLRSMGPSVSVETRQRGQ